MTNLNQTAVAVNPQVLTIKGTRYAVTPIPHGPDGTKAFRLTKMGGSNDAVYDVLRTHFGLNECSCPHYELRLKGNTVACCKHGDALVQAGLLEAPAFDPGNPQPQVTDFGDCVTLIDADYEPSAEDWENYGEWAEEVDSRLWNERIEAEAMFDFPAWIAAQASMIRLQGTEAAGWLADQVEQLVAAARALDADGPESYEDRKAACEDAAKHWGE